MREDAAGAALAVHYPYDGTLIARLHEATPALVDAALRAAQEAQPAWAALRPV
nr:aldehyde dehydrogenase family protein [bacterium]